MLTRREFLEAGATASTAFALAPYGCAGDRSAAGVVVNDIHSQLNATRVYRVVKPASADAVVQLVRSAMQEGRPLSIAGGRHAMGGQQFGSETTLVDMGSMRRVLGFDAARGLIDVEAGIEWPELMRYLVDAQQGAARAWGIRQKQTGADRLSIGGALAANAHGRGLKFKPFIGDVESFVLVDAGGIPRTCSRQDNAELFRLAIGGYGLFGVITSVRLRLAPRVKVQRQVEILSIEELMPAFERRIAAGFTYGDFQYHTDPDSPDFLRKGVFSCYRPVAASTPIRAAQKELSEDNWKQLIYLAHTDRARAIGVRKVDELLPVVFGQLLLCRAYRGAGRDGAITGEDPLAQEIGGVGVRVVLEVAVGEPRGDAPLERRHKLLDRQDLDLALHFDSGREAQPDRGDHAEQPVPADRESKQLGVVLATARA